MHSVSSKWLDRHFELTEAHAPWLDRIGAEVADYCTGSTRPPGLDPGYRSTAACTRSVTVVYGFDGELLPKLGLAGEALFAAGWGEIKNIRSGGRVTHQLWGALTGEEILDGRNGNLRSLRLNPQWRPNDTLQRPAGMEGTPPWETKPLAPTLSVTSISRGRAGSGLPPDDLGARARRAPRNFLLLDNSAPERRTLEEEAFRRHEHALAVNLSLEYYCNTNAKARPHQIPRYCLPTAARW